MAELNQESQSPGGIQVFSLAHLCQIPIEIRTRRILELGEKELSAALEAARLQGAPLPASLDPERLAWTLAFNVEGGDEGADAVGRPHRGLRGYIARWPLDRPWARIWSELSKPFVGSHEGKSTLLSELALSVACEHRSEWQNPRARPVDHADANRAFEFVYSTNKSKVLGSIGGSFGSRAGIPEWISDEAWARVFCDYWSLNSRRRFLGCCRISTLVCQVARHIAIDDLRRQENLTTNEAEDEATVRRHSLYLKGLAKTNDPEAGLARGELRTQIKDCLKRLSAHQRIVAEMVWFRQMQAKRVAEILHVSEPAVSQHLKKARESLRNCLKERGTEIPS